MGENIAHLKSVEVTKICLEVLDRLKSDPNPIARHPSTISTLLDTALQNQGYESHLSTTTHHLPPKEKYQLDFRMQQLGFSDEVISSVRSTMAPRAGEINGIIKQLLQRIPTGSFALGTLASPLKVMADYKQAMAKVSPYVDQKTMSAEAASEYAHIMTIRAAESSLNLGLSNEISDWLLSDWIKKHPEIPEKVLIELNLGGVRDLQSIFSGPELEA